MSTCTWQRCNEPAVIHLVATGPIVNHEGELCIEHAHRMRDNLLAVGCTVSVEALPAPARRAWWQRLLHV